MHIVLRRTYFLLVLLLACHRCTFSAEFKIGPDTTLDSLAIAAGQSSYLVAWRDLGAGITKPQMMGAFVSTTGVLTSAFPISDLAGQPQPSVVQRSTAAFDATNFMLVW